MRVSTATLALLLAGALPGQVEVPTEGTVKLYVHDDLRRSFGFTTGDYGHTIQNGIVHNTNSQLMLGKGPAGKDAFLLGWQGGERGIAVDLGLLRDKATANSLFWRIGLREVKQRLQNVDGQRTSGLPVGLGHVYACAITGVERGGAGVKRGETLYVRLLVVDHAPGRFVEVRYSILNGREDVAPAAAEGQPRWMRNVVKAREDVTDPKSEPPVARPAYVTDAEAAKIQALLDTVAKGGLESVVAKRELVAYGHKALADIVNRLREIDYLDVEQSILAFQLNKILEEMTVGMNVGFVPVEFGEEIDPRKADWNAKTAMAWRKLLKLYPTAESFEKLQAKRRQRAGGR